jgi:hypothetical protein
MCIIPQMLIKDTRRMIGALLILGLLAAALGVGCGGGGDDSTTNAASAPGGAEAAGGAGSSEGTGQPNGSEGSPNGSEGSPGAGAGAKPSPGGSSGGAGGGESSGGSIEGGSAGGSESGKSPVQSAKAKFIERANAICSRATSEALGAVGAQVKKKAKKGGPSESEVQAESIHTAFLPAIQAEIEELEALTPPPGDEEQIEEFLDALQEGVDTSMETEYTPESVASFGQEFSDSSELAVEYGFTNCSLG